MISKLGGECLCYAGYHKGPCMLAVVQEGNGNSQLICSCVRLPNTPYPFCTYSETSKLMSFLYTLDILQIAASVLYLKGAICFAVSSMVGTQPPIVLWLF